MLAVVKVARTHAKIMEDAEWSSILKLYFRERLVDLVSLNHLVEVAVALHLNVQIAIENSIVEKEVFKVG